PGKLAGDDQPDKKAGNTPENRNAGGELDRTEIVVRAPVDFLRRQCCRPVEIAIEDRKAGPQAEDGKQRGMEGEGAVLSHRRGKHENKSADGGKRAEARFA